MPIIRHLWESPSDAFERNRLEHDKRTEQQSLQVRTAWNARTGDLSARHDERSVAASEAEAAGARIAARREALVASVQRVEQAWTGELARVTGAAPDATRCQHAAQALRVDRHAKLQRRIHP